MKTYKNLKMVHLREDIYGVEVVFIWGGTYLEIAAWWDKTFPKLKGELKGDEHWCGGFWRVYTEADVVRILWLKDRTDLDSLTHEVCHLAITIFDERDIEISMRYQEPFCYYQEFWFGKLHEVLKNNGKLSRSK